MNRLTIICLFFAPYFLGAQATWEHYRNHLDINDVLVHQNKLWIATDNGLFSMDRTSLQTEHFTSNNSSLPDQHIQTLAKDAMGNLWIGTYDLALVQIPATGGNWNVVNYPTNPSFSNVYCSKVDQNGDVWMGTNDGLLQYNGSTWQIYPMASAHAPVWDMEITSTGKIFIGSFNLQSFENGVWTTLNHDSTQSTPILTYSDHDLYLENDSTVWLLPLGIDKILRYENNHWQVWDFNTGTLPLSPKLEDPALKLNQSGQLSYNSNSNKFVYYDGANWQIDSSLQASTAQGFQNFLTDENGDLWMFDQNKIIQKSGSTTISHELTELKNFNGYEKLIADNSGNMLMLSAYYLYPSLKIENGIWSDFSINNNNNNNTISTFNHGAFDANNHLWVTTRQGTFGNYTTSILEQTATGWIEHNHSTTNGQLPQFIQQGNYYGQFSTVLISSTGTVWVQYGPNYIFQYKNGVWSVCYATSTTTTIQQLQVDNLDNLWWLERNYNANYQIKKYDGVNTQTLTAPTALSSSSLYLMHADNNGNLWIAPASLNTLEKFDGSSWTTITIPANFNGTNLYPRDIKSHNGKLYIATSFGGLFDYDGTTWNNTNTSNSDLAIDVITQITFDSKGDLWIEDYHNKLLNVWKLGSSINTSVPTLNTVEKLDLTIYPNPTVSKLNIQHPEEVVGSINILDTKGQVVQEITTAKSSSTEISVEHLPAGNYWIKLNSKKNQYIQPFVKY